MDVAVVHRLLSFRPFKRFTLVTLSGHEYEISRPNNYSVLVDEGALFWTEDGTSDFLDLSSVERIKVDGDFGFEEFKRFQRY